MGPRGTDPVHTPFPASRGEVEGVHLEEQLISQPTDFPAMHPGLMGLAWTPQATLLLSPHPCRGAAAMALSASAQFL